MLRPDGAAAPLARLAVEVVEAGRVDGEAQRRAGRAPVATSTRAVNLAPSRASSVSSSCPGAALRCAPASRRGGRRRARRSRGPRAPSPRRRGAAATGPRSSRPRRTRAGSRARSLRSTSRDLLGRERDPPAAELERGAVEPRLDEVHRGRAHERRDEEVRRPAVERLRRVDLLDPPARITATRSPSVIASTWSCVT